MFQQFLDLGPKGDLRIYALLHPTGLMDDPWIVTCNTCAFTATKPDLVSAQRVAKWHDQAHDVDNERRSKGLD